MTTAAELSSGVAREPGQPPVLVLDNGGGSDDTVAWVGTHRDELRRLTVELGALLVRGLPALDDAGLGGVLSALGAEPVTHTEGFAHRDDHGNGVYSSAVWPDHQLMCMHHELSYRSVVPSLLALACRTAPTSGGATALADGAAVLDALPADLVARFEAGGWLLRRTLGGDVGPSVADAFGTDSRDAVAAYCRENGILAQWQADGTLRTSQRRPAVVTHPVTGRRCWFNQVAFLSEWTMDEEVREFLVEMAGEDSLPFTTAYGDGTPVDAETAALINDVYDAHTVREPWRDGDLLLIDNIATAHNREPYQGPREVRVALADPIRTEALAPLPGPVTS